MNEQSNQSIDSSTHPSKATSTIEGNYMDEADPETSAGAVSAAQAIANAALAEAMAASSNKDKPEASRSALDSDDEWEGEVEDRSEHFQLHNDGEQSKSNLPKRPIAKASLLPRLSPSQSDSRDEDELQGNFSKQNGLQGINFDAQAMKKRLHNAWRFALEEEDENLDPSDLDKNFHAAYQATLSLVGEQLNSIIQDGLQAYKKVDQLAQELALVKETLESKDQELNRLRETGSNHLKTIQNLLRAVEKTKTDATEASKTALVEVELHAEMRAVRAEKDKAQETASQFKRKHTILGDELQQIKTKLSKVEQEKVMLERDRNATMSWAKSVDNSMSSDFDFYKRKVTEQNADIQGLHAVVAEKNSQIQELRRQIERSMSNNRLAQFRASQVEHHQPAKKARKRASY